MIISASRDSAASITSLDVLFLFPCLIALTGAPSTMLNRSNESGHPYFVQFKIDASAFAYLVYLAVGLS